MGNGDGSQSCSTSYDACDNGGGGSGDIQVHSLRASFDLGLRADGQDAGALAIRTREPRESLCTPQDLFYTDNSRPADVEIWRDANGALRQVKTPQMLADIVTIDSFAYEIRFYDKANWGSKSGNLYVPVANGQFVTWRIENPDDATAHDRLSISKKVGGTWQALYLYEYDDQAENWTLYSGPYSGLPLRTESRVSVHDTQAGTREDTRLVYEGTDLIYQAVEEYTDFGWGHVRTGSVVGTGANAIVTSRGYYTDAQEDGKYKKIKWWTRADGSWQMCDYDTYGRKTYEWRAWKDTGLDDIDTGAVLETKYEYSPHIASDYGTVEPMKPRTVTESLKLSGKDDTSPIVLAKTYHAYYMASGLKVHVQKRCPDPSNSFGSADNLVTTTTFESAGTGDTPPERLASFTYEDGRKDIFTYDQGTYSRTGDPSDANLGSFTVSANGKDVRVTVVHEGTSGPVQYQTTKQILIRNAVGQDLVRETHVYDGSAYARVGWTVLDYDARGHMTDVFRSNGTHEEKVWSDCCGLVSHTSETGVETSYDTYDAIGRLTQQTKEGVSASGSYLAQADIVTAYDRGATASGFTLTTTTTGGTSSLQTTTQYDKGGRVIATTDISGLDTTRGYSYTANGNYVETVDPPDGPAVITEYYLDGRIKSVKEQIGQNQVVREYFDYGVTSGLRWTKVYHGPNGASSPMWTETTADALGRVKQERKPGYNSSTVTTDYVYNDLGQLEETSTTGMADVLYEYDAMGNPVRSGLDVGDNGQLDLASTDRITDTERAYYHDGMRWWRRTVEKVYATDNDGTATTVSQRLELLTGFDTNETQRMKAIDVHENERITSTVLDRTDTRVSVTVDVPDSTTDAGKVIRNGVLQSETSKTGLTTTYSSDDLGRRDGVQMPRYTEPTETAYYATGTGKTGKVYTVTDPAGYTTTYDYDATTGLLKSITNADGKTEYIAYTTRGQVRRRWGDTAYPVEYEYDDYGRKTKMHTFRGPESGGTPYDFTGDAWPNVLIPDPPVSDDHIETTTWTFEEATGLLTAKTYDDGNAMSYTYTSNGQLDTRTWARSSGGSHVTDYDYDSNTGELTEVDYADSTPDVTFTYNRLGRKKTVSDVVGTRTFSYGANLQLLTESIDGSSGGLYSTLITRKHEGSQDTVPGRDIGFDIGIAADPDRDYDVDYHYDSVGRFQRIEGPALPGYGVQYAYVTNSDLLDMADFMTDATTVVARADYAYEDDRDLMTVVDNQVESGGLTTFSKYDYRQYSQEGGYDALGRRTSVVYSGPAFGTAFHVDFDYNDRSELTTADRKTGDAPGSGTLITPGPSAFDYVYDLIGNRVTYNVDNSQTPTAYSTNDLNQYTATTYPTESFADPDEDGNFVADGTYSYTWDCENRLISIEPTGTPAAGDKKLEFAYDYLGRRVEKVYSTHNGSTWSEQWRQRFVYDKWNVVLVLDANDDPERKYTWGLDLSRTVHDAGGVGGLLAVEDVAAGGGSSHSYWFFYDANGNVGQLVKASDQSLAAHYEYAPYGDLLAATGSYAATNSIRFSTKWFDTDLAGAGVNGAVGQTGLGYWGYRYYSPRLGRWLNRDPIGEGGGRNLYGYLEGQAVNVTDFLGLFGTCTIGTTRAVFSTSPCCGGFLVKICVNCAVCEYSPSPPDQSQTAFRVYVNSTCSGCGSKTAPTCPPPPGGAGVVGPWCQAAIASPDAGNCQMCCKEMFPNQGYQQGRCSSKCGSIGK